MQAIATTPQRQQLQQTPQSLVNVAQHAQDASNLSQPQSNSALASRAAKPPMASIPGASSSNTESASTTSNQWLDPSLTTSEQLNALRAQLLGTSQDSIVPTTNNTSSTRPDEFKQTMSVVPPGEGEMMDHSISNASGSVPAGSASPTSGDDGDGHKRGNKRELSTSKRAAQNRAAQRAFRQRKESYIKDLEGKVRDYTVMEEAFKQIQAENHSLRSYIINLQSRLIESQGEDAVPTEPVAMQQQPAPAQNPVQTQHLAPVQAHSSTTNVAQAPQAPTEEPKTQNAPSKPQQLTKQQQIIQQQLKNQQAQLQAQALAQQQQAQQQAAPTAPVAPMKRPLEDEHNSEFVVVSKKPNTNESNAVPTEVA